MMRISYDAEHDILRFTKGTRAVDSEEVSPGISVLYGHDGKPVGALVYSFSHRTDAKLRTALGVLPGSVDIAKIRSTARFLQTSHQHVTTVY